MPNTNKSGNINQPRRKKNKKPVRRYSEEYSNRPNPYTGYSADGNYHPEAKKHASDEASVASAKVIEAAMVQNEAEEALAQQIEEKEEAKAPVVIVRKKNIDREAEKKALEEKREARRDALNQMSQGVAAHSVSEQVIEDISSFSETFENLSKKTEHTVDDNTIILLEEELEKQEKEVCSEAQTIDVSENKEEKIEADFTPLVILNEDETLPFDCISSEQKEQSEAESKIPPLKPEDLIPVLDFDRRSEPVLDFSSASNIEQSDKVIAEAENIVPDIFEPLSIEDILRSVEAENISVITEDFEGGSRDITLDNPLDFETQESEAWDGAVIPPLDIDSVVAEIAADENNQTESQQTNVSDAISKLLDECFNDEPEIISGIEEEIAETEEAVEPRSAEELYNFAGEDINELEVVEPKADEPKADEVEADELSEFFDAPAMDEAAYFAEENNDNQEADTEADSDNDAIQSKDESLEETDAVEAKLRRLVEAAELAEIFRSENQEVDGTIEDEDAYEHPIVNIIAESSTLDQSSEDAEVVKEYVPTNKAEAQEDTNEEVFESVLIVDDADSTSEEQAVPQDDTLFLRTPAAEELPTSVFKLPENHNALYSDFEYDDVDFREQWLDEEINDEYFSNNKKSRRRISAFIGALAFCFAIIGVSLVLKGTATGLNSIGGSSEKKSEYTQFISPVVLNDPIPFTNIKDADNQMLLESALWSTLDSKKDDKEYSTDDTGKIVIPAKKVVEAGKKLFGKDIKLDLNVLSESEGNVLYYYDSIDDTFHISQFTISGPSAEITKIAQSDRGISLKVGYHSSDAVTSSTQSSDNAYKYMEYVLAVNDDGSYHIESIQDYKEN